MYRAFKLFGANDLTGTFIADYLKDLANDRQNATNDVAKYSDALNKVKTVLAMKATDPPVKSGQITSDERQTAANFQDAVTSFLAVVTADAAAIDAFETALFSGAPVPPSNPGNQGGTQNQAASPPGIPQQNPALPLTGGAGTPSQPQTAGGTANGGALAQLLASDLLVRQVLGSAQPPDNSTLSTLHVLVIQTLESGGGQITKSNLFTGSKPFFSGGTVATFGLFGLDGHVECGGYAYSYGGYIPENADIAKEVVKEDNLPGHIESDCKKP
jgi:hypothetical protein